MKNKGFVVQTLCFAAHGGHMLEASVSTESVEILITLHDKPLERKMWPEK